ncbi:DCD domain-containing protein NRP [Linum perenne]
MEPENKNEEVGDHSHSPTKSQSAEENKEEAVEPSEKLVPADGKVIIGGEDPVKGETNDVRMGEEDGKGTENVVETSSKADTSNGTRKRLRARAKVVKKSPAGSLVKTRKALLTAEVPVKSPTEMSSADDQMTDVVKAPEEETVTPEIKEEKNEEAESLAEALPTEDIAKTTPTSLRARPKLVKKASAGISDTAVTGTKPVKRKLVKKKIVKVVKKVSGGNENGVAKDSTSLATPFSEDVQKETDDKVPTEEDQVTPNDEQVIGESSKTQENQMDNGKQPGGRKRLRKRKRKADGGAVSQIDQKKQRPDSNDAANQDEKRKGKMDSDSNLKDENSNKNKNKEITDDKGKSARDSKGERHGGLIFMCSSKTKPDCFNYHVMGVPAGKKDLVMSIKPGLKLFLFDFDLRLMYGIYEASSAGGEKLEPKAFSGAFPYQVRFKVYKDCVPLPESTFKKAIKENYNKKNRFDFELTPLQVRKLTALFRPANYSPSKSKPLLPLPATAANRDREPRSGGSGRRDQRGSDRGGRRENQQRRDAPGKAKGKRDHPVQRRTEREPSLGRRREMLPRREPDLYMSEREYRAYGLQSDRRNMTPPPRRSSLDEHYHERDRALGRQVEHLPIYREQPVRREVVDHHHPLYYPRQQVEPPYRSDFRYGAPPMAAPTTSVRSPPGSNLEPYSRDRYYPYSYDGAPSSTSSTYLSSLRREVSSLYERRDPSYLDEADPLRPRERERETARADHLRSSAYASDLSSRYADARYYPESNQEANAGPVSSRYSFAGPSSYTYR